MDNPFYVEVDMSEYSTGQALWKSKPKTMLIKVAESQALRRAFSITGIYTPEEMSQWELEVQGIDFKPEVPQITQQSTQQQTTTNQTNEFDWSKLNLSNKPKWQFTADKKPIAPPMVKRLFAISNKFNIPSDEFKTLCENITDKKHSYEWTYGDIKLIEETLNTINDKNNEVVEPEEVEPELIENFEKELDTDELILNTFPGSVEVNKGFNETKADMKKLFNKGQS